MLESSQFDAKVSGWLRERAWSRDGTRESLDLITAILNAQYGVPLAEDPEANRGRRVEHALAFLRTLSEQSWYQDGFDSLEKRQVQVLVQAAASQDASASVSERTNPEFAWMLAARRTLDASLFDSVETADGRRLIIAGVHGGELESYVLEAIALTKEYYRTIEDYAGPIEAIGVVVAVDEELRYCGLASGAMTIVLHPVCVADGPVVHELIHLAAAWTLMPWFNEGIAYVGAGLIAERQPHEGDRCEDFEKGVCDSEVTFSEDEDRYSEEASLGTRFIGDLVQIVGKDVLSKAIKSLNPHTDVYSEDLIFDRILEVTPPENARQVQEQIWQFEADLRWVTP